MLAVSQQRDDCILKLMEKHESSLYAMINGMIYRKLKNNVVRFYVPREKKWKTR